MAGQQLGDTRELVRGARPAQLREVVGHLLQAQHVEIGDAPRIRDDAGEVATPIDAESPLDVPCDELHRTLSNPFGQVSRPVHHAHNFNATRHEPVYDQIISFDENTRP